MKTDFDNDAPTVTDAKKTDFDNVQEDFVLSDLFSNAEDVSTHPASTPTTVIKARHRTANRSFHLITNKDLHDTFIDADCRLDHEGYPLYPNNETTFVLKPGDQVTNFGHVGFPATNQTEAGSGPNKDWKIVRRRCLGVMRCSNVRCTFLSAPPTGIGKVKDKIQL